jgi:hypothetical protein
MHSDTDTPAWFPDEPTPWQARFEDERVKMILKEFRLLAHLTHLLADCQRNHNARRLTFESFYMLFPTFPVLLAARCRSRVAEHCSPVTLFRSFEDVFFYRSYLEVYSRHQEEARGRPVGMVVPFGYRGGLVAHNGAFGTRAVKMTYDVPDDVPPHRITVEPFSTLLRYLALGGWTPDSSPPARPPTRGEQVPRDMPVTPRMVERLGPGPALVVLAWLRKVLSSPSGYDRHFVRRTGEGQRCVAATQEQVALETGLSGRQVKRGLAALRHAGLIASGPRQARTHIWLAPEALALAGEAAATER